MPSGFFWSLNTLCFNTRFISVDPQRLQIMPLPIVFAGVIASPPQPSVLIAST
jgi:hypothetical protein